MKAKGVINILSVIIFDRIGINYLNKKLTSFRLISSSLTQAQKTF